MTYKFTEAAAQDIEGILRQSLAEFGLAQTEEYFSSLTSCLELLGGNPKMGSAMEEIRPGYRRFTHKSHVIYYKPDNPGVLIVRILHKHMDATRHV